MVTDDERRRVAAALRRYVKMYTCPTWRILCGIVLGGDNLNTVRMIQTLDRLADLIEPPAKLYDSPDSSNSEADEGREVAIDREALLALADELETSADLLMKDDVYTFVKAGSLLVYADRIREACGEVAS